MANDHSVEHVLLCQSNCVTVLFRCLPVGCVLNMLRFLTDYSHGEMSPASSCSVTSGTPSTDVRFAEYHLEKVSSYFTPEEVKMSSMDRPARAYSVGSRPEVMKRSNR